MALGQIPFLPTAQGVTHNDGRESQVALPRLRPARGFYSDRLEASPFLDVQRKDPFDRLDARFFAWNELAAISSRCSHRLAALQGPAQFPLLIERPL